MKTPFLIIVLVLIALIGGYHFTAPSPSASNAPAIGGHYSLTNQDGIIVGDADFKGKYQLVFFGFTNCPDICPTTLTTISQLMDLVDAEGKKITPVFISVDSEDNPEGMKLYLTNFSSTITGLTGTPEQIKQTAAAFKVYYARVEQPESSLGYTMDHSAYIFFMDKDGNYITHFSHDAAPEEMAQKITPYLEK